MHKYRLYYQLRKKIYNGTSTSFDYKKSWKLKSDKDPNLFGSCSAPEPDPYPNANGHENQDPNKVGSDQQCCFEQLRRISSDSALARCKQTEFENQKGNTNDGALMRMVVDVRIFHRIFERKLKKR